MLAIPRPVLAPSTHNGVPPSRHDNNDDNDDDESYLDDLPSQRPSVSDDVDRFYLPVCSPVVTNQPTPLPPLSSIPGNFPSAKDDEEAENKPTKRTSPLVIVQTGVFYFFSCGWCGMTETSKRVRKEAEVANQSLRERWRYEVENRPKALRKLIKTTADNVETNIVPSIMARVSHHYHHYTGTEQTNTKQGDVMSMASSDTYAPMAYSRWRRHEVVRAREGSQAAPLIQNFAQATSATHGPNNDLMWMMEPPPAPVWKSDGKQAPRLALADEDEMLQENIKPRLVSRPTAPSRPKPTIMRIATLPSIESLASRVAEEQQQQEAVNLPRIPPTALQISSPSYTNRRISRPQPLVLGEALKENTSRQPQPASPQTPPFSAPARSLSWETTTEITPRSSSERDFNIHGSDGASSPTTIYSTAPIPRLGSPSLTKAALASRDENGNLELTFGPRRLSVTALNNATTTTLAESNGSTLMLDKVISDSFDKTFTPIPDFSVCSISPPNSPPRSPGSRAARRRSIPLTGFRV
ncbi:hypothetical protein TWF225_010861 [Orbilia oligospora]|uniref:Uncharacterized protein n=1 Tax=Orbilia oligospora TaxID=2813651 RepID=A0A8H2E957_ORBOL|nr:hypothetical protein TWF225_010861 [Orbilia oligospora]KAF3252526.1 hypothetical protein TWF217_007721 [Orbilia oligospora]KAF3271456.1 hypothetical protein TWF128_000051 [Orbilia oligospora]KAF3271457.1 hypothetical protein TWF128_000051 [Orbilia oligospora]TGJ72762.1 hypothetical protein EYR41_004634 [Orbilia oligospora]